MGIANHRVPRTGDIDNDRIGYIRRSLTHRERQSIKSKAEWRNSARGRSHLEIKRREEESTTSQEEWENMELEESEVVINPNEATNGGQQTGTHTNETNKSEAGRGREVESRPGGYKPGKRRQVREGHGGE